MYTIFSQRKRGLDTPRTTLLQLLICAPCWGLWKLIRGVLGTSLSFWCEHNEFQENTLTRKHKEFECTFDFLSKIFSFCSYSSPFRIDFLMNSEQSHHFRGAPSTNTEARILWPPDMKSLLIGEDPDAGEDGRPKEKGPAEDEMVR